MKAKLVNGHYLFERESKSEPVEYVFSKNHGLLSKVRSTDDLSRDAIMRRKEFGITPVWYDETEDKVYECNDLGLWANERK